MSAEDTEPSETGVEDAGCDDDAAEGLEEGFGCVAGDGVAAGSGVGVPSSLAACDAGLSTLAEEDVGATIDTTEEDFGS